MRGGGERQSTLSGEPNSCACTNMLTSIDIPQDPGAGLGSSADKSGAGPDGATRSQLLPLFCAKLSVVAGLVPLRSGLSVQCSTGHVLAVSHREGIRDLGALAGVHVKRIEYCGVSRFRYRREKIGHNLDDANPCARVADIQISTTACPVKSTNDEACLSNGAVVPVYADAASSRSSYNTTWSLIEEQCRGVQIGFNVASCVRSSESSRRGDVTYNCVCL
jgi:hypothetical protein